VGEFETPVIIDPEVFHAVQHMLEARRPTRVAPRIVTGPTLLTGLVRCETCGGGMTIRTGKGGRYRYYTCNNRLNEGPTPPARAVISRCKFSTASSSITSKRAFSLPSG
jgi:hypothetical protein